MKKFKELTNEEKAKVVSDMLAGDLDENLRTEETAEDIMKFIKENLQGQYKLLGVNLEESQKHMKKSPEMVLKIRELLSLGYNYSQVARNLGICRSTVVRVAEKTSYLR